MKRYLFLILGLLFIMYSCEENELSLPTEVTFEFSMETFQAGGSDKSQNGFTIDEGVMLISNIQFDGQRDEGEDYYFSKQYSDPLETEMHTGNTSQHVAFDVPQGVYNKIDIAFTLGKDSIDAFELNGKFSQGPLNEIPVRIEYNFMEQIEVQVKDASGNGQIVLKKDTPVQARVVFKTPSMFQLVNFNMIQNAEVINIDGVETILINNEVNSDVFNLLASRIDNSLAVVFE